MINEYVETDKVGDLFIQLRQHGLAIRELGYQLRYGATRHNLAAGVVYEDLLDQLGEEKIAMKQVMSQLCAELGLINEATMLVSGLEDAYRR